MSQLRTKIMLRQQKEPFPSINLKSLQGDYFDPTACFTGDTLIYTGEGYKEIKDIKVGDEVYSENPETGEKGLKKVVNVFVKEVHQIVHIVADGEDIDTTATHPFWVEGKGWTEAGDIKSGDKLKMYSGKILEVKSAYVEYFENPVKVYNIEVEDWHTYFVSEDSIFVHNGCKPTAQDIIAKEKKGSINSRFPKEWLNSTLEEINAAAKKLLQDKDFDKGFNSTRPKKEK